MQQPSLFDDLMVWTVSELSEEIRATVEKGFPRVWVEGEISNLSRPRSGHVFFSLKDPHAVLKAVIWRSGAFRLPFEPHNGLAVLARGRLSVYPPSGEYRLIVDELQPKGLGAQDLALRQLKESLSRLGYFAPERKKPVPRFPRRLALVTSPRGAAVRDMLEILGRRWPQAEVWICPVRVQGPGAAEEIARAVQLVNRADRVDVLILGRGGGSHEDLAAFNQQCVAEAIYHSRVPVISAVGHEIDVTIADLVADRRALTPSEAAELATPDRAELMHQLQATRRRLTDVLKRRRDAARKHLDQLARRRVLAQPLERVRDLECRLDNWEARLQRALDRQLDRARQRLQTGAARMQALSPLNVLARGYSLTRTVPDKHLVRQAEQVRPGDRLEILLQEGRIVSRVEETHT